MHNERRPFTMPDIDPADVNPRFWEAIVALQQAIAVEGLEQAMRNPAHAELRAQMMNAAPAQLVESLALQFAVPVGLLH